MIFTMLYDLVRLFHFAVCFYHSFYLKLSVLFCALVKQSKNYIYWNKWANDENFFHWNSFADCWPMELERTKGKLGKKKVVIK